MKRLFTTTLAAVVSLGLLAGCTQSTPEDARIYSEKQNAAQTDTSEAVTVNFFGFKADAMNLVAVEDAIHGFMDENPGIEVKYEGIKGAPYEEALLLRAENGALDDIVMVHHDNILKLNSENMLADLSDLSTIDGFNAMAKTQFIEEDGSVYFLPTSISTYTLYVNLDMLEENGFEVPTNWAQFSEQCAYYKEQGITPIVSNNYAALYCLMSAKSLYPVYQMDDTAEMIEAFNTGEADIMDYLTEGVEMVGTMLDEGWLDREEVQNTNQTSDDLALFAQGDRPFMITGGWASQRLMAMDPACEYAIYPFPILDDGSVLLMNVDTCISVNADSENLEEAKKFVEYLTQPNVIYDFCDTQSCYTPLADDRTPTDQTIVPAAEYLFNGESVIGSDYRLKLPLDEAEKTVADEMLAGMGTQEAIELLGELIKQ